MLYSFSGEVRIEGDDVDNISIKQLEEYLQNAVSLDLDTESEGSLTDDSDVVAIELFWGTLEKEG